MRFVATERQHGRIAQRTKLRMHTALNVAGHIRALRSRHSATWLQCAANGAVVHPSGHWLVRSPCSLHRSPSNPLPLLNTLSRSCSIVRFLRKGRSACWTTVDAASVMGWVRVMLCLLVSGVTLPDAYVGVALGQSRNALSIADAVIWCMRTPEDVRQALVSTLGSPERSSLIALFDRSVPGMASEPAPPDLLTAVMGPELVTSEGSPSP